MNDNYYMDDMIGSLKMDTVMERYYPLINYAGELTEILNKAGAVRKEQVTGVVLEDIRTLLGDDISSLFTRFIHIYDFNESKLREIKGYVGTKAYPFLAQLLRLPGVRILRAELYYNSGVTLEVLAEKSTENIINMVCDYIQHENRSEIIPRQKEMNCHKAVAKMILRTDYC